jgi:hypothetical protein
VERALNTDSDIMGSFFDYDEDKEDGQKNLGQMKGDKITQLFTF